jgi:hypothetical protein
MPKAFYTEKDIEDLVKRGILSLEINDTVVLTELAYEKAARLGMKLVREKPDNPPSAPVRPYIANWPVERPAAVPLSSTLGTPATPARAMGDKDLPERIRTAVVSRLGTQVDPGLLDAIIQRVLASTGLK